MKALRFGVIAILGLAILMVSSGNALAEGLGTEFAYQGRLT